MTKPRRRRAAWLTAALGGLLAIAILPAAASAGSSSTDLANGAALSVSLDAPANNAEYLTGDTVNVSGTASVGIGDPSASLVYVVDTSGSTGSAGGACGTVLACEKAFVSALNSAAASSGSIYDIGLGRFSDSGTVAYPLTPLPAAGFATALAGLAAGGGTNFNAGLGTAVTLFSASAQPHKVLVFISDGFNGTSGSGALTTLTSAGVQIFTVAVGSGSGCGGSVSPTLAQIAAAGGGTCTHVTDPNDLPGIIPNLIGSTLDSVALTADGNPVTVTTSPALPQPGPASVNWSASVAGLAAGDHQLCATSTGTAVTGGSATTPATCVTVHVLDIALTPATATNELGTPGQTHSVTATISAGTTVAGRTVSFTIPSGPNAGKSGAGTTNAAGAATFTYTATQGTAGLGTDSIKACFTTAAGATDCASVTKLWRDTTAPAAACVEGPNPGGNVPNSGPNAGKSGQNPDGFYTLTGTDAVGVASIVVKDSGSPFVSNPFATGDNVKITQTPGGTPSDTRPGPGGLVSHLKLKGDALLVVTDTSGNSTTVSCKVAPPPK